MAIGREALIEAPAEEMPWYPRWILLLVIFGILVLAMHLPRLRSVGQLP